MIRQAIVTKKNMDRNGNTKYMARAAAGLKFWEPDDALDQDGNHIAAAKALREKLKWVGPDYEKWVTGVLPDGSYVHVQVEE